MQQIQMQQAQARAQAQMQAQCPPVPASKGPVDPASIPPKGYVCYTCNVPGHWRKDCPKEKMPSHVAGLPGGPFAFRVEKVETDYGRTKERVPEPPLQGGRSKDMKKGELEFVFRSQLRAGLATDDPYRDDYYFHIAAKRRSLGLLPSGRARRSKDAVKKEMDRVAKATQRSKEF